MTSESVRRDELGSGLLGRFGGDRSGNAAILFALASVVLMLASGAAVDIGRWLNAREQTAAAIDAALLAGGRHLQTNGNDADGALAAARKFYDQNVKTRLPVTDDSVAFQVADNRMAITANGTAYIKTPFLQLANIDKLPLLPTAKAEFSKAVLAIGGNGGENVEISMMLDVTGSMRGKKLEDLKDAAKDLIGIVVKDSPGAYSSKVAIVPFSEDIRLPTAAAIDQARGTGLPPEKSDAGGRTYYLSDCVVERTGTEAITDAAPASGQYVTAHYTSASTMSGGVKQGVCTLPAGSEVVPLSSSRETLLAKVDGLSANGGTAGHLGTAWAWYTLSPSWASLWSSESKPADYGSDRSKIAILMTDGEYNTQYDKDGIATGEATAANGSSTTQARALCAAMKAKGITIYTVGFQISGAEPRETLNYCASDPGKYYEAADGEQLKQSFRDIGLKLSSLYLSK